MQYLKRLARKLEYCLFTPYRNLDGTHTGRMVLFPYNYHIFQQSMGTVSSHLDSR